MTAERATKVCTGRQSSIRKTKSPGRCASGSTKRGAAGCDGGGVLRGDAAGGRLEATRLSSVAVGDGEVVVEEVAAENNPRDQSMASSLTRLGPTAWCPVGVCKCTECLRVKRHGVVLVVCYRDPVKDKLKPSLNNLSILPASSGEKHFAAM